VPLDDVSGHAELPDRTCADYPSRKCYLTKQEIPRKGHALRQDVDHDVFRAYSVPPHNYRRRYAVNVTDHDSLVSAYIKSATTPRLVAHITTDDNDNTPQFRQFMSSRPVFRNIAQHGYLLPSFLSHRFATSRCANRIELWNSFPSIRVMWITCYGKRYTERYHGHAFSKKIAHLEKHNLKSVLYRCTGLHLNSRQASNISIHIYLLLFKYNKCTLVESQRTDLQSWLVLHHLVLSDPLLPVSTC